MSLVGSRPERPVFVRQLELVIPDYRERLRGRPGITGLAQVQVQADKEIEGVRSKVAYDIYDVNRSCPGLDFRIFVATALKIAGVRFEMIRALLAPPSRSTVLKQGNRSRPGGDERGGRAA